MKTRTYQVTITGTYDLLMHQDSIDWADMMDAWRNDPENKKLSKAGDDRSPAFRWLGALYHDGEHVALPSEMLMKCFMQGGGSVPVPGAKGNKTFKAQTQSGALVQEPFWKMKLSGKLIPVAPLLELQNEPDFKKHQEAARTAGFELFVKRATINNTKHIKVRPRFAGWSASGSLAVWDDQLTPEIISQIWMYAGRYKGLGNWRPSAPKTPGPFGTFEVKIAP